MERSAERARMLEGLIAATHLSTMEQVPDVVTEQAARAGWCEVLIYAVDLEEENLHLLTGGMSRMSADCPKSLSVDGTVAGRAFRTGAVVPADPSAVRQWWVPLMDGTERIGVIRVAAEVDTALDKEAARDLRALAGMVALILMRKAPTSDTFAHLVRRRGMSVNAEMEWWLMPPRTFATDRALVSAVMEPAYEVSGDAFDYGVAGDVVRLAIFDAMGHDTSAGLTANLALAACRNHRRRGGGLDTVTETVEKVLSDQFGGERYATGVLAEIDGSTGVLSWVNRGHLAPFLIRGGHTVVQLECPPEPPMGMELAGEVMVCREQLQPGDRLVLYTDGVTESRRPDGEEFGLDRLTDFLIRYHTGGLSVPETLRKLMRRHLAHNGGRPDDDATVVLLEWHGPGPFTPHDAETLLGLPESSAKDLAGGPRSPLREDDAGEHG